MKLSYSEMLFGDARRANQASRSAADVYDGQGGSGMPASSPISPATPEQLQADIEAEQAAIQTYRQHIAMIDDRYIKAVLARIVKDEQLHLRLFTRAYQRYCRCYG